MIILDFIILNEDGSIKTKDYKTEKDIQMELEEKRRLASKYGYKHNEEEVCERIRKDVEQYNQYVKIYNAMTERFFGLYQNGTLQKAGYAKKTEQDKRSIIDFCIDADKLPSEVLKEINEIIPKPACIYSGCYPIINRIMMTYRDNCGCIGRSWEVPMVQDLDSANASTVGEVLRETNDPYKAGLKAIELINKM